MHFIAVVSVGDPDVGISAIVAGIDHLTPIGRPGPVSGSGVQERCNGKENGGECHSGYSSLWQIDGKALRVADIIVFMERSSCDRALRLFDRKWWQR